jgi:hypothetical protein
LEEKLTAASEPKVKKANGKTYYWCIHHKQWTVHTQRDCTLGQENATNIEAAAPKANADKVTAQTLSLIKALMGLLNGDIEG